ncbi:RrF2 family transcriptional regulator [Flavobacterium sp. RHBU_24]|uniref:RrF2 family transcriptional regulator n=1 Tax=Flavobacterium sp. RHBU_24 TaxID=3391185 RepID=UPI003984A62C
MISGKFAINVHILTLMTRYPQQFLSSDFIAGSMNINPVLVRKEVANLKKHNIVESREGKFGGTRLAKPASEITLEAIYNITFDCVSLGYAKNDPNPECPVGKKINNNLDSLYKGINEKICCQLKDITLTHFSEQF